MLTPFYGNVHNISTTLLLGRGVSQSLGLCLLACVRASEMHKEIFCKVLVKSNVVEPQVKSGFHINQPYKSCWIYVLILDLL